MADQPINGLPKKTTVADTDSLLMIGASEEYQIDYGKLADAILNKITSKAFTLDQGSKTLVAALNELNSNILSVNKFFKFGGVNTVGYKAELKNIPPGIYYFNINTPGSVEINENFTDQVHRDPEWHDYGKTGDGIMFVFGNNFYSNYILVGYKAVIAFRQLTLSNKTWYNTWQYSQ